MEILKIDLHLYNNNIFYDVPYKLFQCDVSYFPDGIFENTMYYGLENNTLHFCNSKKDKINVMTFPDVKYLKHISNEKFVKILNHFKNIGFDDLLNHEMYDELKSRIDNDREKDFQYLMITAKTMDKRSVRKKHDNSE